MLDYLYSNLILDPALVYAQDIDTTIRALVDAGDSTNVASSLKSLEQPLKEEFDKLREIFFETKE